MTEHIITVDVYAHWGDSHPRYRLYVDQELLTERDFVWPGHEVFIRENIVVNLKPGPHEVRIEQIGNNGRIQMKNVTRNGEPSSHLFVTFE